jgi:phosphonate transport system ATP-binding protein
VPSDLALRLASVEVRYGGTAALAGFDLTVRSGERVALVGPSGAGKTTLLSLAAGLVTAGRGHVEVLGEAVPASGRRPRSLRRRVGVVPQAHHLVGPLRVLHNVEAGRLGQLSTARALWALLRPNPSSDTVAVLEEVGLADRIWERTDALSGGQQQRVAVARALLHRPELVLADEPVASLDPTTGRSVMELLRAGSHALLVSLHDPEMAREHCDRVIGVRDGRMRFDRPAAEVGPDDLASVYAGEEG